MINKLKIVRTESTNVFVNQAVESALFDCAADNEAALYLWYNERAVVIGRNQCAETECKTELLESEGGLLARRLSGGGAVFHDEGNLNFTFISKARDFHADVNTQIIVNALKRLGLDARPTGRNDIEIDGAKVSGNAYLRRGDTELHHGTLLIASSADDVARYLTPANAKFNKKAVKSVSGRVSNLRAFENAITNEAVENAIIQSFISAYPDAEVRYSQPMEAGARNILTATAFFASDEWRYGKKEKFDLSVSANAFGAALELGINVADERISEVNVFTDSLDTELADNLSQELKNRCLRDEMLDTDKADVQNLWKQLRSEWYEI